VLSGRGLCDGLIIRSEESYRLWRVVVCDHETSQARRLKPARGLLNTTPDGGCSAKGKKMVLGHTVVPAVQKEVQHKIIVLFGARIQSTNIIGNEILAYDSVGLLFVLHVTVRYCRIYKFVRLFTCS